MYKHWCCTTYHHMCSMVSNNTDIFEHVPKEDTFPEYCTLKPSHLTRALVSLFYILHVSKEKGGGGSCRTSVSWWMSNENIMGPGSGLRHSIKWGHQNTEQNTSQHSKVIIESKRHANFLTLSLLQFWSVSVFIF